MNDIYKVFTIEAVLIGILSVIFGVGGYYFTGLLINQIVSNLYYDFYFTIFTFDIISVVIMIVAIIAILSISLIIPMSKLTNIKPIDVINSNN